MNQPDADKLSIRAYTPDDQNACGVLAHEAWQMFDKVISPADMLSFITATFVQIAAIHSNRLEVACINSELAGYLFGRVDSDFTPVDRLRAALRSLALGVGLLVGRYGLVRKPLTLLYHFIRAEAETKRHPGNSDAEVVLFVVAARYRSKGVGKTLMQRFLNHARERRARRVTLQTDSTCNWRFYEIYGFERIATFPDAVTTYLTGREMEGFIYALDLDTN